MDWRRIEQGRVLLVAEPDWEAALLRSGVMEAEDPESWTAEVVGEYRGRGRPRVLRLEGGRCHVVVKAMEHGGLLAAIRGRRLFWTAARVSREMELVRSLIEAGIPTPRMVFARVERVLGPLCRLTVGTENVCGARDLRRFLKEEPSGHRRRRAVEAAGALIGRLHEHGVDHTDLNLGNVLVIDEGAVEARIIDLDNCRRNARLDVTRRKGNLVRFWRSAVKLQVSVSRTDGARFLRAYAGSEWRGWFRQVRARGRWAFALHRLRWRLTGQFAEREERA